jgi:hypothetical protein
LRLHPDEQTPYGVVHWRDQRSRSPGLPASGETAARVYQSVQHIQARLLRDWVDAAGAIAREKQIKAGSRQKKIGLIDSMNPEWRDLYEELVENNPPGVIASEAKQSRAD